jgi:hypothetical protein
MNDQSHEPQALVAASENPLDVSDLASEDDEQENPLSSSQGRHDGWTGQRMAMFCALLAETGIVTDACIAVGMSTTSAYSARRRNPLFAAAWEESLKLARDRLADALLERSLNGCVEKYYRDGELVGEKRILDNRLGMQVLRRLDRRAEQFSCEGRSPDALPQQRSRAGLGPRLRGGTDGPDWDLMLSALRTGEEAMVAEALAEASRAGLSGTVLPKVGEVGEVCVAGNPGAEGDNFDDDEPDPRCWRDEDEECWMTDFPPPADFTGYQKGRWGDEDYKRECTREEAKLLDAALDSEIAEDRTEDESLRDSWFEQLKPSPPGEDLSPLPGREGPSKEDSADEPKTS